MSSTQFQFIWLFSVALGVSGCVGTKEAYVPGNSPKISGGKVISTQPPRYPETLVDRKLSGDVLLCVDCDKAGVVIVAKVMKSDDPVFAEKAKAAARHWRFSPPVSETKGMPARPLEQFGQYFVVHFDGDTKKVSISPR